MYINKKGYLERKTRSGKKPTVSKASVRSWFLIKSHNVGNTSGQIVVKQLSIPKEYVGKRIRIKATIEEM